VKTYEVQNDTSKTEKHTPYIEIPSEVKPNEPFQVTVQVGKTFHIRIWWNTTLSGSKCFSKKRDEL